MSQYAKLVTTAGPVDTIVDLTTAQFNALSANKRALLKPLIVPVTPVPDATHYISATGYQINANDVTVTYILSNKTAGMLAADSQKNQLAILQTVQTALQTDIDDDITAAPTTAAEAFLAIQDLKRRAARADRILLWLLKQYS